MTHRTLDRFATIEARCAGTPVYAFGYTYVLGQSPDLLPGVVLQERNARPKVKIRPKKSWELKENRMGSTPAREPKTAANDDQPLLPVHLIDGDPETCWSSRGQVQPDVEDVWIRIDLPIESRVSEIAIVPHAQGWPKDKPPPEGGEFVQVGQALPRHVQVQLSRDAWHWDTVYENSDFEPHGGMIRQAFRIAARKAKQIRIVGRNLPSAPPFGHCFSISGVEVLDAQGRNLALLSRGAAVTVSSTQYGYGMDRFTQDMLWPLQYDLGFKWTRVGYHMGTFTWPYVEREKGVLEVDARSDAVITEAVEHGLNVVLCLDVGNWLYAKDPKRKDRTRELMETYFDWPPAPTETREHLRGYLDYVRYMVRHFRDRVRYFEVFNEWCPFNAEGARSFAGLFRAAVQMIREEYPDARIVPSSSGGTDFEFALTLLREVGPIFDVIGWHPFYQEDVESERYLAYPDALKGLQRESAELGFRGEFMATEWAYSAPYPPASRGTWMASRMWVSEMQKAKYAARLTLIHLAHRVVSFWNETFQQNMQEWSIGLLRNTSSAWPLSPTQPEPVYYVLRTLATAMDEAEPTEFDVVFGKGADRIESYAFQEPGNGIVLALWLKGKAADDDSRAVTCDLTFPGLRLEEGRVTDVLNGETQSLNVKTEQDTTVIPGFRVHDWPVLVEARRRRR